MKSRRSGELGVQLTRRTTGEETKRRRLMISGLAEFRDVSVWPVCNSVPGNGSLQLCDG